MGDISQGDTPGIESQRGSAELSRELAAENQSLRSQLQEAWRTIEAMRRGAVPGAEQPTGGEDFAVAGRPKLTLRESEERLRLLFDTMSQGVVFQDASGSIISMNRAAEQILGKSPEEFLGSHSAREAMETIREDGSAYSDLEHPSMVALQTGKAVRGEIMGVFNRKMNQYRWISIDAVPLFRDGEDKPYQVYTVFSDITDRKRAEQVLRESEERFRSMFEEAPLGVGIVDSLDARFYVVNPAFGKITGWPVEELQRMDWVQITHPDDVPGDQAQMAAMNAGKIPGFQMEKRYRRPNGAYFWVNITVAPMFVTDKSHPRHLLMIEDIDARKRAEKALRESEAELAEAQRVARIGSWSLETAGGKLRWSEELYRIFEVEMREVGDRYEAFVSRVHPEDRARVEQANAMARAEGKGFEVEYRIVTPGGGVKHIREVGYASRDADGRVKRLFGTAQDVTEQREAERELLESRERVKLAMRAARLYAFEWDPVTDAVKREGDAAAVLGVDFSEETAATYFSRVHPDDQGRFAELVRSIQPGRDVYTTEYQVVRPDGEEAVLEESSRGFFDREGRLTRVIGMVADITQRRKAEKALRESEERLALAASGGRLGMYEWDIATGRLLWNEQNAQLLGLTTAAGATSVFSEHVYREWAELVHPDDLPRVEAELRRCLAEHAPYESEHRVVWPDGSVHWVAARGVFLFDAEGQPVRMLGTYQDITDRKRAEEALADAKAAAEAANAAKSQFLANMSHELRTPLNAILGMMNVALPRASDPIVQDCLQTARGSADILLALLNDFLDSAKTESGKLELESDPFSLRRVLQEIKEILTVRASEKSLVFSCQISDGTPDAVIGDRMRLQQVLLNLAGNAIKFTERGEVGITVRPLSQEGEVHLEFAVRDTGIGIPPASLEHLFQPFAQADASMSRRFGGTGLGLSISKSLVEKMNGRIWVESEEGKGSTFYFTVRLPLAKELPSDTAVPTALSSAPCRPLRVLLAEDNPANQKFATYILKDRGHRVDVAENGKQAISLFEHNHYDVILMDVQMPGMDGFEATKVIRARENSDRRQPIIAMTAHAMKGDRERCLSAGMDCYLSKPIDGHELIETVEQLAGQHGETMLAAQEQTPETCEPVAPTTDRIFDLNIALRRCSGEYSLFQEMVESLFEEAGPLLHQMRWALVEGDATDLGSAAHRLKGLVGYLGAGEVFESVDRVEQIGRSGRLDDAATAIDDLVNRIEHLETLLERHRRFTD